MPPEFKPRRVTITPTPLGDGRRVAYPVPTSPVGERFARAVCVAPAHDPMAIESCSLIIERSMVTKFAQFLARHGGIEREPTEQETTALMQSVADFLAHMQMEAMALVSEALSQALGDPNAEPEAISDAITTSMAQEIAAAQAREEGRTAEQARADAEEIAAQLRAWADRKMREIDGEEGAA
jgi:hypothetical protein